MHAGERPARLCTLCTVAPWLDTLRDLRKRVTAIYWGSSGRRFKSCQPDADQKVFLASEIGLSDGLTQTNDPNQLATAAENRLLCRGQSTHGVRPSYSEIPESVKARGIVDRATGIERAHASRQWLKDAAWDALNRTDQLQNS